MKKTTLFLLSLLMIAALTACAADTPAASSPQASASAGASSAPAPAASADSAAQASPAPEAAAPAEEPSESGSGARTLVVYFSCIGEQYQVGVIDKGNTAIVAEAIAARTGADLYEIVPSEPYPLVYGELTEVAQQELRENARPAIAGEWPDLSPYDTVFIGAPVWWGDWPMICYTFFESADLSGKTLYPFSTHGGSGLSGFDGRLQEAAPGSTVGEGLAVRGADCQNDPAGVADKVAGWLQDIGL